MLRKINYNCLHLAKPYGRLIVRRFKWLMEEVFDVINSPLIIGLDISFQTHPSPDYRVMNDKQWR
jgi:hypothetical protein